MFRDLDHKMYEKTKLGLFRLEKRLGRGCDCSLHLPEENYRKDGTRIFSVVHAEKTRTNSCNS